MAEIVFVNPRDWFLETPGDRPPLGLLYLSSYCKERLGKTTRVVDMNHEGEEALKAALEEPDARFCCFSVPTASYTRTIALAKKVRTEWGFRGKLIAGGTHITDSPSEPKTLETFDYSVVGDGEDAMRRIFEGSVLGKVVLSKPFENVDELPMPDFDAVPLERYGMKIANKKASMLISSRGCMFSCVYCGSSKIKKWRPHSPQRVVAEIERIAKLGYEAYYFGDDIFSFSKPRVYEICRLIKEKNLQHMPWRATTRIDLVDVPLLKEMRSAGCEILSFGFESGNDKILEKMRKGATTARARQCVKDCREAGIKVKGFFIIGLPDETWDTAMDTINFAKELDIDYCDAYPLSPWPSTPIWDEQDKLGIKVIMPEDGNWEAYYQVGKETHEIKIHHPNLTTEQIWKLIELFKEAVKKPGMTYG